MGPLEVSGGLRLMETVQVKGGGSRVTGDGFFFRKAASVLRDTMAEVLAGEHRSWGNEPDSHLSRVRQPLGSGV